MYSNIDWCLTIFLCILIFQPYFTTTCVQLIYSIRLLNFHQQTVHHIDLLQAVHTLFAQILFLSETLAKSAFWKTDIFSISYIHVHVLTCKLVMAQS